MFANTSRSSIALAAALALGLALGACAHNNPNNLARAMARRPGQRAGVQPDGRRPRLLRHRPDRSLVDRPGDARQAGGVAQSIQQIQLHHRGPRRRARHARINFALGSRRAQAVHDYLVAKGVSAFAHEDDQLWQGAARRGLRRHFLLVAEPSRRHGAQRGAGQLSALCEPARWLDTT